uniref:Uncharacterized protein LOC104226226 n=1 Tax=Nicotiana sylvestris TaxID=4096 RepID=A0A1U7WP65_NICSY|nr:PREDICTED: uncharacterized protein LOC104226226 [Nicotiana sylvestris]
MAEELEEVAPFEEFLERKFHLGTGLHPELRYPDGYSRAQVKLGSQYTSGDHLKHLQETFDILREHNMKLNPEKCAFGVTYGSFPVRRKNVIASSHCSKRRRISNGHRQALKDLKKYFSSPLLLLKPKEGEALLFYLAVLKVAVSAVLVREDEVVVTTFPLRNVIHKPELSGRLSKWAIEMSEFDIEYKPRTAIKSQVLANFVANFSLGLLPLETKEAATVSKSTSGVWNLFTDEASNVKRSGLGIVLITPSGETLRQAIRTIHLTNNEVEYEVLTAGLELDQGLDSEVIEIKCDSQLVVNQVYGIFDTKEERMQQYVIKVQDLLAQFREWSITHIAREKNAEADALANLGSLTEIKEIEFGAVVKLLNLVLDTDGYYEVNSTSLFWEWRNEIIYYLEHGKWPEDHKASRALHVKAARYCFKRGQLYRKFFQGPLARCLGASKANYVMR